jgi:FAD/FMN-containing dehydrogenase
LTGKIAVFNTDQSQLDLILLMASGGNKMIGKELGKELGKIVGKENVIYSEKALEEYSSDMSLIPGKRPRCVVKPENAGDVQKIVVWANNNGAKIVPVSSGAPHFRGDTVPGTDESVMVDLSHMKKIVHIDPKNRVALIEPGVTFSELVPRLQQEELRLNMPFLPRSSKSVVGSLLEREPVMMPKYQWDASDPLGSTEVVFGNGDKFRTGSGSGPGGLDYQWESGEAQVASLGPAQADFHRFIQGAQGTIGIVTWASVRCERLPRLEESFLAGSSEVDSLLDLAYWLVRLKVVDECLILNKSDLARVYGEGTTGVSKTLKAGLPPWILFFCIAGYEYFPEERIAFQKELMMEQAKAIGLKPVKRLGISASKLLNILRKPCGETYWKLKGKGSCDDLFFVTNRDSIPEFINVMNELAAKQGYPVPDIGVYIQPVVGGTSWHCEFHLFFDPQDHGEVNKVRNLSASASRIFADKGAFFSRPYGAWADLVYQAGSPNTLALKKVKSIFDPNNVMNPGKLCF